MVWKFVWGLTVLYGPTVSLQIDHCVRSRRPLLSQLNVQAGGAANPAQSLLEVYGH